jgi:DNA-directed RNA polymerase subunit RPC12/RpoP/ATP-dependent exoDNAse (exonuclease V) beta subunit
MQSPTGTTPRATQRLSKNKPPERCPHCNSRRLIKKGTRRKKLEDVPLYRCRSCGRTFSTGPRAIRNKTYPLPEILETFTLYDRGSTLEETSEKISSRYGHRVAPSTISRWLAEHPALTTYRRLRDRGRRLFSPTQLIRTHKLYHRQVYEFAYHRAKLAFLKDGTLDNKRATGAHSTARFSPLAKFLESIPQTCPHDLFSREDGTRSSQLASDFISIEKLVVVKKQNAATDMAALIVPAVGSNYERHPTLQRFMLANDSTTIAVEVPVWLTRDDIAAIEKQYRIQLFSDNSPAEKRACAITGHIDFLQVRNGAVHILDYKPDARTKKPIAQLTVYALALARLTGLNLFDIKCAWFNENEYCEFFPRALLARGKRNRAS